MSLRRKVRGRWGKTALGLAMMAGVCLGGAASAMAQTSAGSPLAVGSSSTPISATLNVTTAGTLSSINVTTQGASGTNSDFIVASGGSCIADMGTSLQTTGPTSSCTVMFTFAPTHPGTRYGAITLASSTGQVLATTYLVGTGLAPQISFSPSSITTAFEEFAGTFGNAPVTSGTGVGRTDIFCAASFQGMVRDGNGNIFFTNLGLVPGGTPAFCANPTPPNINQAVVNPADVGVFEVLAGTGTGCKNSSDSTGCPTVMQLATGTTFSSPRGMAIDGAGNLFVVDSGNDKIYEITAASNYATAIPLVSGSPFSQPFGVAVDGKGDVFVADSTLNSIKEIQAVNGVIPATPTISSLGTGQINTPNGVAVDSTKNVFIVSAASNTVQEIVASNSSVVTLGVTQPNGSSCPGGPVNFGLNAPLGVAVDGVGNVFVSDTDDNSVDELFATSTGTYCTESLISNAVDGPQDLIVDGTGAVFAIAANENRVELVNRFSPSENFATTEVNTTSTDSPKSVTVSNIGNTSLSVASAAIGTDPTDFSVSSSTGGGLCNGSVILAEFGTCTYQVSFTPVTPGAHSSSLVITDNNLNAAPPNPASMQTLTVSGQATAAAGMTQQTINFNPPLASPAMNGQIVTLSATANLTPVIFTVVSGPATISNGNMLTYTGIGTVVVEADQFGNGTFADTKLQQTVEVMAQSTAVGAHNNQSQTVDMTFTAAGKIGSIVALTKGAQNLDFNVVTGAGTCTLGATVTVSSTCTVNVTFNPTVTGIRYGAVELVDTSVSPNVLLATTYITGTGTGAQVSYSSDTTGTGGQVNISPLTLSRTLGSGFGGPFGVAVDGAGNVLVADTNNHAVKEIVAASGSIPANNPTINTLGSGFVNPDGVAVDGAGNVFVADTSSNGVKEIVAINGSIPASPTINTLGSGFNQPTGVAVDGAGNVFVADFGNNAVKEIVAVNGTIPASSPTINTLGGGFNQPFGVAVDGAGNVFVADTKANLVEEIVAVNGIIPASNPTINMLGSGFKNPDGVAVDANGNVFVADTNNGVVKEIVAVNGSIPTSNPTINTISSGFVSPAGIVLDGAGNVYVADFGNSTGNVVELDFADAPTLSFPTTTAAGSTDTTDGPLTVSVNNIGNQGLAISALSTNTNSFTLSSPGTTCSTNTVAAQASCNLAVSFTPITAGSLSGAVSLIDIAVVAPGVTEPQVRLSGTAASAVTASGGGGATLTQGQPSASFTPVTGGGGTAPLTYSITGTPLPAGLTLNSATGQITGTPTGTSTATSYTVTVTDAHGATQAGTFSLTVNAAVTATGGGGATLTQNHAAIPFTPVVGGGGTPTLLFSVSPSLSAGLTLNPATGQITGTPTGTSGATTFTITVTDSNGATSTGTFNLTVNAAVTASNGLPSTLTQNHAAIPFTPVTGGGGTGTLGYSVSPALPAGLSLNSATGQISGTPTGTSTATSFTVTVTDTNGATSIGTFSLTVNAAVTASNGLPATLTQNHASTPFTPVTGGGGTGTLNYSVSPSLPAGLTLNPATGQITGTPTGTSTATSFTVTVTDTNGATSTGTFNLTVNAAVTASNGLPTTLTQNHAAIPFTPVTGGGGTGTLGYSLSPALPAGLTLNPATGQITGTPTVSSTASVYTVTVTDSNGATSTGTFNLTVNAAVTASNGLPTTLTQNHAAIAFTPVTGGGGTAPLTFNVSPALPTGLTFDTTTGQITGTPTVNSGGTTYSITVTDKNGATSTATFSLTVSAAVTASNGLPTTLTQNHAAIPFTPVTGGGGTGTLSYSVSPSLPTGLTLNAATGQITGTPTVSSTASVYTVTVTDSNGATSTGTFSLTVNAAVTASNGLPTTRTQNHAAVPFTPVIGGGGTGTLTYSVSPALPAGLSLNPATGQVTGTPTVSSTATAYTITVTDANGATATSTFSLTVNAAVTVSIVVGTTTLTQNHPGATFTPVIGGGGTGALSYSVSPSLPTGLAINTATGQITGTPTGMSGATKFTISVTDTNGASSTATFSLAVSAPVTASSGGSATLTQNHAAVPFTPVTGGGGTGTLTYGVSPVLPAGLSLNTATGQVTGTPTVSSTAAAYTVTVTDSNSATATATFSLTVNAAVTASVVVGTTTLTQDHPGATFTPVIGGGGTGALSYSVSPSLPAGLTLNPATGQITGTSTISSGATAYTVTVKDAIGATSTGTFNLTVNATVTASGGGSTTLTQGQLATPFTLVTGSGGTNPLAYSVSPTLPTGLSISTTTGQVTGTPTVNSAAATYTVTVTDANGETATASFSLAVNGVVTATGGGSTTLTQNNAATPFTPVTGSGGTGTLKYSVSPSLPAGLSISPTTGQITGTPTVTSATTTYTVTVKDANGATSAATFSLTVLATPATATVSLGVNSPFGSTAGITVTATETGNAGSVTGGVVTFSVIAPATGSFSPATCTLSAAGTCTTTYVPTGTLAAGTYANEIGASFAAVGNYTATSGTGTLTVSQVSTKTVLTASNSAINPNQTVTLTSQIVPSTSGTPTGSVTFFDNGTALQTVSLASATASYATALSPGTSHTITAIYSGDTNYLTSASASAGAGTGTGTGTGVIVTVAPLGFTLTTTSVGTNAQTVAPGAAATFTFAVSPNFVNYAGPVTFTVSGLPVGATASFTPNTIPVNGGVQAISMIVQTPSPVAHNNKPVGPLGRGMAPIALALLLLPFAGSRKLRKKMGTRALTLLLVLGGLCAVAGITGCGTGVGFQLQQPQSYTLTVTATSGSVQQTNTVTLTVQ